jgi:predicted transcriptional regulator
MKTIEIRDFPKEVLKRKMLDLMSDGKTRWGNEIATKLGVDIKAVINAFKELESENKLFIDTDMMKRI